MTSPLDVVVIGNAGVDTNVYIPGQDIDFEHEANFTSNIDYVGQAGGYAVRGYAQLGWRTGFIGAVGNDMAGELVGRKLGGNGVDLRGIFIDPAGTARSINFMYSDGRRKNFYDGKSHMDLPVPFDSFEPILKGARLAHFNIPNWARRVLPLAKRLGVTIACDIQDITDIHDPYRSDFITYADYLFFSAANFSDPAPLVEQFLAQKPGLVVISGMGAKGCALGTQAGIQYFPPPALELPVIDTNGAGDGLAVGFLTSRVLEDRSLEESIRRGQVTARYSCSIKASTDQLITREELDRLSAI
ncbi:MAG TPA: carbohydrate kinase family protein [Longilinea sp.]|nr:carbohydrate kinase family protein [Longilinea sp.]